jgi:hypothetical protein
VLKKSPVTKINHALEKNVHVVQQLFMDIQKIVHYFTKIFYFQNRFTNSKKSYISKRGLLFPLPNNTRFINPQELYKKEK